MMFATLRSLIERLPAGTTLYPGHDYGATPTSTLDAELAQNPFLKLPTIDDFVAHRMKDKVPSSPLPPRPSDWTPPSRP